jgi:N6-L-threonylcarbamoyladenine synthase
LHRNLGVRLEVERRVVLLGIETSCDDTATAVVRDARTVLANVSTSQDAFHERYGGIVPEIASRRHVALLSAAIDDALGRAGLRLRDVDGIAVTAGPGLIGSLVVGVAAAKALAFAAGKPLFAINHLHGHIFAAWLDTADEPAYPFLALLVSGGHSQLVDVISPTEMSVIGKTRDDAAGEAFDKTARLLGLGFPGGPALERLAATGNPRAVKFPRHRADTGTLDMSFSGIKTSVRHFLEADGGATAPADVAASFQAAVVDVLIDRVERALGRRGYRAIVLSGGVAACVSRRGRKARDAGAGAAKTILHRQRGDDRRGRGSHRTIRPRRCLDPNGQSQPAFLILLEAPAPDRSAHRGMFDSSQLRVNVILGRQPSQP